MCTPAKQIAWNMLHEIWNIYMMQQINIFQCHSAHYVTRNIRFLKYISWNLLIVLREEMLRKFRRSCHVFHRFKWKDCHELREIYFLYVHWAASMLHTIYLWNMFRAICFIGVRCAWKFNVSLKCFHSFSNNFSVHINWLQIFL